MPLLRLGCQALTLALAAASLGGCGAAPPPDVPGADLPPASRPEPSATPEERAETPGGHHVSGRLVAADGTSLASAAVVMRSLDGAVMPIESENVRLLPDGSFEFRDVPPGRYEIRARGSTADRRSLVGLFRVSVAGGSVTNLAIRLIPAATLSGRLIPAPSDVTAPQWAALRVRTPSADGSGPGDAAYGAVGDDGTFTVEGLMAGTHVLAIEGLPDPWVLERVTHRGRDVTDTGLDVRSRDRIDGVQVTITSTASEVTGLVLDGAGDAVGDAAVVVLPAGARRWNPASRRMRLARTAGAGRYRIRGLPPGEYRIAAARLDEPELELYRPGVLDWLREGAAPFTIRGAEGLTIDLRLSSPGRAASRGSR